MAGSANITGRQHYVLGIGHPVSEPSDESHPLAVENSTEFPQAGVVVISSDPPNDADGRPDGTIYIQTA
jgi:hypothetical protein